MMDIFQQRYYKINKQLLSAIGQWPYQVRSKRFIGLAVITFIAISQIIPQIIAIVEYSDDPMVIYDSIGSFETYIACGTKLANIIINSDKMLKIMERIKIDWTSMGQQPEIRILEEYAENGRQFTIVYTVGVYVIALLIMAQPVVPKIFESIIPGNETRPAQIAYPVDYYGIDFDTYYYYIVVHSYICVAAILTVVVAADTLFIVQVQHACGMFTALGHQLKRMADAVPDNYEIDSRRKDDPAFQHLAVCIRKHIALIEFGELLETSYTWAFFSIVGFNMLVMSVTGFQTVVMMDDSPQYAVRYATFTVAQIGHLFVQCFFSQRLMDHSRKIHEYTCQSEWYETSLSTQKLLSLITLRTYIPCQLTAGKFMVMSLETFASILKASMSYFTLLRSMQ